MLTHDLFANSCCDNLVDMEPAYRTKSNLNKNLFNQKESGYSTHSIVQCMETFVDAVREMDDTILVPSRLMDLKVDAAKPGFRTSTSLALLLATLPDLFTLYTMVRNLKTQLQWGDAKEQPPQRRGGAGSGSGSDGGGSAGSGLPLVDDCGGALPPVTSVAHFASAAAAAGSVFLSAPLLATKAGHVRRPSTASMSSTNSSTASSVISEPDSEASSIENDSGIDAELEACVKSISSLELIEQSFQRHLRGLGDTLNQLTEAARYVTKRYQKDVLGIE